MSNEIIARKSKYDLSDFATLKVPSNIYYILKRKAQPMGIHWSELARDFIVAEIKRVIE